MMHQLRLAVVPLLLAVLASCGGSNQATAPKQPKAPFVKSVEVQGAESVLVFMANLPQTREIYGRLTEELSQELSVIAYEVHSNTTAEDLKKQISEVKPRCVVLMNNPTLKLYKTYQQSQPKGTKFPPAVVVMSSFLEEQYSSLENTTGIAYELPAVTLFTNLRSLLASPVKRVGVIYRPMFKRYLARQMRLAEQEHVETVGIQVSTHPSEREVRRALKQLKAEGVDALWVLNDNALLTPKMISSAWLPGIKKAGQLPVIVGTSALLSAKNPFGTFAMVPDHGALGVQAANLVFEIADNGWALSQAKVQLPLSVRTVVDIKRARQQFNLKDGALARIDEVIE